MNVRLNREVAFWCYHRLRKGSDNDSDVGAMTKLQIPFTYSRLAKGKWYSLLGNGSSMVKSHYPNLGHDSES